jgi:AraC-like DNA-binding protein
MFSTNAPEVTAPSLPLFSSKPAIVERVEAIVVRLMPSGNLTLDLVGTELRMRPRTLQRKLHEHGTSLSMIVDEVRRAVASRLLTESNAKAWAIATELGFRDKTAFYRAFRRWTGSTPRKVHPAHAPQPAAIG